MYGGFNQIGRTGMLTYPATVNQAIAVLPQIKDVDPYFLIAQLNQRVSEWRKFAASSRKDPNITKRDIEEFCLSYTNSDEQKSIGKLTLVVDTAIAHHQRH